MTLIAILSLQFATVQNYIAKQVAKYLSKELHANITLDYIYFKPFTSLELVNLNWRDKNNQTVASIESLTANLSLEKIVQRKITIQTVSIEGGFLNFEIYQDSTNLSQAINYFSRTHKKNTELLTKKMELNLKHLSLKNNSIKITNQQRSYNTKGVNFSDIYIDSLSGDFDKIKLDSTININISDLTLKEKSGFTIQKLNAKSSYTDTSMEFKELFVKTNKSLIQDYIKFEYESIDSFNDFVRKVKIKANLQNSKVSSRDIEYFAPTLSTTVFNALIEQAELEGTVDTFKAKNTTIRTSKETEITGNFNIIGLSNINTTIFDFHLTSLKSTPRDIEEIVAPLNNNPIFKLPNEVHAFENFIFKGTFKGMYHNFDIDGICNTNLGIIATTSKINITDELSYSGKIISKDFYISKLIESQDINKTDIDIEFEGKALHLDNLTLKFQGNLSNTNILNYNYKNIQLNGNIAKKELKIIGNVEDENLLVDFRSSIDWNKSTVVYDLNANLTKAALNKLNWVTKDNIVIHRAAINTNLTGNSINTLVGGFHADSITMTSSKGRFDIAYIDFRADGEEKNRTLTLNSDVLDAQVVGNIDLYTIIPYFKSLAMRYAPASAIDTPHFNSQNFSLSLKVKSFKPISALINPNLSLDDGTYLNASFSSDKYTANFTAFSPNVVYKGLKISNIEVHENADDKAFVLNLTADRVSISDSIYLQKISINNILANDSLRFTINVSEPNAANHLILNGNIHFAHNTPAFITFQESSIIFNNKNWNLNKDAILQISKGKIYVSNLLLDQDVQQIKVDGIISNEKDNLNIKFNQFSLESLNGFSNPIGINLKGNLNGSIQITSILKHPFLTSDIKTSTIFYNEVPIGNLNFNVSFDPSSAIANLDVKLLDEEQKGFNFAGYYNFSDKRAPLNIQGKLTDANAIVFQPFLKSIVSDLRGQLQANIGITGSLMNPSISGTAELKVLRFMVDYLKVPFSMNNQLIIVNKNNIQIQDLILKDSNGKFSKASGAINLGNITNPLIDIDLKIDNSLVLNTTLKDNSIYYGTAYMSGDLSLKGSIKALDIRINAKSEQGTIINIPFNSASTISESDFIYFINKDSSKNEILKKKILFSGITMNMDLNLTPNATVNIPTNLGTLKGNGEGTIAMKISSLGDFEMFGDYVVNDGSFHFTAQDYFNKFFDIKQGGTIRWTGKPSDATININALYQQRTSIQSLYNAAGHSSGENERVLAQADMLIKGTLGQPDISFDLNFPQNPYIKDQLQSYLSDANNVNQQALSLIVRRGFTASSTEDLGKEVNSTLLSAGAEIAFNQINNIISQSLNINFFDINFRSFNDATASLRLWDDRLILTGGITDRTNIQANDLTFFGDGITTDAELTYKLREDGNFLLRAYNRPYTRNFLLRNNENENISAFGLVYRQEFNSFTDFWKRIWLMRDKRKKEKSKYGN